MYHVNCETISPASPLQCLGHVGNSIVDALHILTSFLIVSILYDLFQSLRDRCELNTELVFSHVLCYFGSFLFRDRFQNQNHRNGRKEDKVADLVRMLSLCSNF